MKQAELIVEVFKRSTDKDWNFFIKEWDLISISRFKKSSIHICEHSSSVNICTVHNKYTNSVISVCSNCFKKYFNDNNIDKIKKSLELVINDNTKSFSILLIDQYLNDCINEWEYDFYKDIITKKRKLSEKQLAKKQFINNKIIQRLI